MPKLHAVAFLMLMVFSVQAQEKKYKALWDLSSADTTVQAAVFRQVNNSRVLMPDLEVEVVLHGKGILLAIKDSTQFRERIRRAKEMGVKMVVCNNSLQRLKVDPAQLSSDVSVVPSAVVEMIKKQDEGWRYIKAAH